MVGCEYRLSEAEILGWLCCFGQVVSEITEEPFDNAGLDPSSKEMGFYNPRSHLDSTAMTCMLSLRSLLF